MRLGAPVRRLLVVDPCAAHATPDPTADLPTTAGDADRPVIDWRPPADAPAAPADRRASR